MYTRVFELYIHIPHHIICTDCLHTTRKTYILYTLYKTHFRFLKLIDIMYFKLFINQVKFNMDTFQDANK